MTPSEKIEKLRLVTGPTEHTALVDQFFVERAHQVADEINSKRKLELEANVGFSAWSGACGSSKYNKGNNYEQTSNFDRPQGQ
jgi:hypothetical protein